MNYHEVEVNGDKWRSEQISQNDNLAPEAPISDNASPF